jgi:recombination protein RecT
MTETIADATNKQVATRDNSPGGMIARYHGDFASVLPSHVKAETWVRLAQGALKKGKRLPDGRFELEAAAANNPGVFLASLLDAARLGLEPGTEQYYLTPRKVGGRLEILGIVGYQGHIELMYRAGAIASVIAEVVYKADRFAYQPGRDDVPQHEIDWDAEDRGPLRLAYAYARMKDGAVSKVIVLNRADIERIKLSSQGANSEYSPWVKHEAAMWLKSAVRQLQKWVPTSAEFRREQLRAEAEAQRVAEPAGITLPGSEFRDDDPIDAEIVDDVATGTEPVSVPPATDTSPDPGGDQHANGRPSTQKQQGTIHTIGDRVGLADRDDLLAYITQIVRRNVTSTKDLTSREASTVIEKLTAFEAQSEPPVGA